MVMFRALEWLTASPLAALYLMLSATAAAGDYHAPGGVALEGFDAVAYFTEGRAVRGKASHEVTWDGVSWRFSSAEHQDAFLAAPDRYAPQYGGYCALGIAVGKRRRGDPQVFAVVDGRLYINFNRRIHQRWEQRSRGFIRRANQQWTGAP
ncbi:MAG: YHS domain-containing (seleno)protein [Pseudomonadota bacterium]